MMMGKTSLNSSLPLRERRKPIGSMGFLFALLFALACVQTAQAGDRWLVAQDGSGDFATVQAAIDAVPDFHPERTTIRIKPGDYRQVVVVPPSKQKITLLGEGDSASHVRLFFDNHAKRIDPATGEPFGTSGSASFFVHGDEFIAENLTFENSAGPVGQALAISIRAPRAGFRNVRFLGHQDTVYTHTGSRIHCLDCHIEGTVDFIFGGATALFERCTLVSLRGDSYITAASTPEGQPYGYVFRDCTLRGDVPAGSVYLGRPWRPYARTVFLRSHLGAHVHSAGWHNWGKPENERTTFYAEHASTGPAAAQDHRVPWSYTLDASDAVNYTHQNILGDWRPFDANVPTRASAPAAHSIFSP
jgi:pectinesterase